ncbi:MAG: peptidoglycan DD-metalloendopeptidase family protein [Flavobacteriales bacterium]|nr:peptidoglycan DD-metalloendopeptidase family protein [Flavobacteriales bacterium]
MRIAYLLFSLVFLASCASENTEVVDAPVQIQDTIVVPEPVFEYGFCIDSFIVHRGEVAKDWTLSHLLLPQHVSQVDINTASTLSKDSLVGLKYISSGRDYMMLSKLVDTNIVPQYCIYDKKAYEFIVFDFTDSVYVYKVERPIDLIETEMAGIIHKGSNLSNEIQSQSQNIGITSELVTKVAQTFAWSIDFFRLHPDDQFKVIYDEKTVEGTATGAGKIKALYFQHKGHEYYAFAYEQDGQINFYDEEGKSNKTKFLMAPLKYSRLSSPYTKKRFHPVQKRWKAHLGTDYAASKGTPIWSTANGSVIAATFSKYNGYYVKVKHDDTYTTQYLHMSKIAPGMKKGRRVSQGETIGYVGSTGLATGPHVCYRFWKNGKQIDHRKEVHQATEPLKEELQADYLKFIAPLKIQLDAIAYPHIDEIPAPAVETDSIL